MATILQDLISSSKIFDNSPKDYSKSKLIFSPTPIRVKTFLLNEKFSNSDSKLNSSGV